MASSSWTFASVQIKAQLLGFSPLTEELWGKASVGESSLVREKQADRERVRLGMATSGEFRAVKRERGTSAALRTAVGRVSGLPRGRMHEEG